MKASLLNKTFESDSSSLGKAEMLKQRGRAVAILDVGGVDENKEHKYKRVGANVMMRPLIFLPAS